MELSVIICTYNPVEIICKQVLTSLRSQSLPTEHWELIIIDNHSSYDLKDVFDISWHPNSKIILEPKPGLSNARLAGVNAAKHSLIVFVDDDNLLDVNYLKKALAFHKSHPKVGCFGGKSIPIFETEPPSWFFETGISLGCQDYGDNLYISEYEKVGFKLSAYPSKAPIGTGMVVTKDAFISYVDNVKDSSERLKLGRKGNQLTSGEDNDIILTIIKNGYEIAYVPELIVSHIIPLKRYSKKYLQKMAFESNKSWVKVLDMHGICPWKKIDRWTISVRKIKVWITYKSWKCELNYIRWKGACGLYKGLVQRNEK